MVIMAFYFKNLICILIGQDGSLQHSWDYSNHGEINAINTTERMKADLNLTNPPSFVLHIGDIAYVFNHHITYLTIIYFGDSSNRIVPVFFIFYNILLLFFPP